MAKISWTDVELYDAGTDSAYNDPSMGSARSHVQRGWDGDYETLATIIECLIEYRGTGGIFGYWTADPRDYDQEHTDDLICAGPAPGEINYAGMDECYAALECDHARIREIVLGRSI